MQMVVDIFIPIFVFLIMLVVGTDLSIKDFSRIQQFPRLTIVSTIGQVLILPFIGFIIAWMFAPAPSILTGIILVAASPGGAISNYYVYLARANVALSVTLTAFSTLLSFLTIPLITSAGFWLLLSESERISIPIVLMISQLFFLLLLPTSLGMWCRYRFPVWVERHAPLLRRLSIVLLILILVFVIVNQLETLIHHIQELLLTAVVYTVISMLIGWIIAAVLTSNRAEQFSVAVEYGVRNLAVVTVVGASLLGDVKLVIFAAAFFLVQAPLLLILIYLRRKISKI